MFKLGNFDGSRAWVWAWFQQFELLCDLIITGQKDKRMRYLVRMNLYILQETKIK